MEKKHVETVLKNYIVTINGNTYIPVPQIPVIAENIMELYYADVEHMLKAVGTILINVGRKENE